MKWPIFKLLVPTECDTSGPRPRHVNLTARPLFHVTLTLPYFLFSIAAGAKVFSQGNGMLKKLSKIIQEDRVTQFLRVPIQSPEFAEATKRVQTSLSSLECLAAGGAKLPPAEVKERKPKFPHYHNATAWGLTETNACGFACLGDDYLENPYTAGRLYPPLQGLQIVDNDGNALLAGHFGEIAVKSACNTRCYSNKPTAISEVLKDRWFKTEDLATANKDGRITSSDRWKDYNQRWGRCCVPSC